MNSETINAQSFFFTINWSEFVEPSCRKNHHPQLWEDSVQQILNEWISQRDESEYKKV